MAFRDLIDDASHMGWTSAVLGRVMYRLEDFLGLSVFRVNTRPLGTQHDSTAPALPGITIREVNADELLEAARDPALDLEPLFVREALARGDLAWGAFEHGKLVCYTWRAFSKAPFTDGFWVRVPAPFQYGYKSFTLPSHRGRGLYPAVGRIADQRSGELGCPAMLHPDRSRGKSARQQKSRLRRLLQVLCPTPGISYRRRASDRGRALPASVRLTARRFAMNRLPG